MRDGNKLATLVSDESLEESLTDRASSDAKLDGGVQARIGDQLRAMYDELMQQPVPDRLKNLLDRLQEQAKEKAPKEKAP